MTARGFDLTGDAFEPEPSSPSVAKSADTPHVASDEARLARELQRALELGAQSAGATVQVARVASEPTVTATRSPVNVPIAFTPAVETRQGAIAPSPVTSSVAAPATLSKPVEGVPTVLALAEVLADPKDNVSRGGRPWLPTDRDVIEMAYTIETQGLIHPPEVRKLVTPIVRDVPVRYESQHPDLKWNERSSLITHYRYKVSSGFCRFAAYQLIASRGGKPYATLSVVQETDVDERRARLRNLTENIQRIDPSEYNLAILLAELSLEGQTSEQVAKSIGARVARVEQLTLIATKLPPALLDVFRQSPTPEMRRTLASIAVIDAGSTEESHRAMLQEWQRLQEGELTAEELKAQRERTGSKFGGGTGLGPAWYRNRLSQTRAMLREAGGWSDPQRGTVRELTVEQREFADELLRWLTDPKTLRNPLR